MVFGSGGVSVVVPVDETDVLGEVWTEDVFVIGVCVVFFGSGGVPVVVPVGETDVLGVVWIEDEAKIFLDKVY